MGFSSDLVYNLAAVAQFSDIVINVLSSIMSSAPAHQR